MMFSIVKKKAGGWDIVLPLPHRTWSYQQASDETAGGSVLFNSLSHRSESCPLAAFGGSLCSSALQITHLTTTWRCSFTCKLTRSLLELEGYKTFQTSEGDGIIYPWLTRSPSPTKRGALSPTHPRTQSNSTRHRKQTRQEGRRPRERGHVQRAGAEGPPAGGPGSSSRTVPLSLGPVCGGHVSLRPAGFMPDPLQEARARSGAASWQQVLEVPGTCPFRITSSGLSSLQHVSSLKQ